MLIPLGLPLLLPSNVPSISLKDGSQHVCAEAGLGGHVGQVE